METPLLQVKNLKKHFPLRSGFRQRVTAWVHAVDGIDFDLPAGETLALVGETGCGKSTTGRLVLRLLGPTEGEVHFRGIDLGTLPSREMRTLRQEMQIIFQDPFSSLNPRLTIGQTVAEPLLLHGKATRTTVGEKVVPLIERAGLNGGARFRSPPELSGRRACAVVRAAAQ